MTNLDSVWKSRHYFDDIGPSSQSYGFSSSHVLMWELDHKEGWVLKNWFFQTGVLEKALESPLDSKEIKPVNPRGNQSWIFIGRTDAEAEAPILWPPDAKSQLIGKDLDDGKNWRQEVKGMTDDEMVGWLYQLNGQEFEQTLGDSEGQGSLACCSPWGRKELVGQDWVTKTTTWSEGRGTGDWVQLDSPGGSVVNNLSANTWDTGDTSSIPGLKGSSGGGNGNPFQCSCLGNPMERGVWRTVVLGVAKSQTWLSNWTLTPKGSNWVNHAYIMRSSWNPKRKEFGFWRASGVVNQWGLGENGIPGQSTKLGSPFYTPCPRPLSHLAIIELHRL